MIKFDENTGEAMISKKLYDEVSKKILPLDDLLFCFFRRILLVCIYAGVMFIVLILGKESGVSGSLQAISTIVAILIPFILDTIYADNHSSQKTSKNMATKDKLEHIILRVHKRERNVIVVDLKRGCSASREGEQWWQSIKQLSWPIMKQSWRIPSNSAEQSNNSDTQLINSVEHMNNNVEQCNNSVEKLNKRVEKLSNDVEQLKNSLKKWNSIRLQIDGEKSNNRAEDGMKKQESFELKRGK